MGDLSKKLMAKKPKPEPPKKDDRTIAPDEANALKKLQSMAKKQGCLLESDGKGGLPPSLVLHVFKRDADENGDFRCKVCGEIGTEENGGLSIHHKAQHIRDPKVMIKGLLANEQGRRNDPSQMICVCARDHDLVHERDREENPGKPDADEVREDEGNGRPEKKN